MRAHIRNGFVMALLLAAACGTDYSKGAAPDGTAGWYGGGTTGAAGVGGTTGAASAGGTTGAAGGGEVIEGGLGGAAWLTPEANPPELVAPTGATVKARAHAVGSQIYTCTASDGADAGAPTYAWAFKAPDARLYDSTGVQFGTHGAGPSWTSNDGSVVNGMKVAGVDAPQAGAIQWLLLRITSTTGAGEFSDVTFVQRLNTVGGVAPATGCDSTTAGTDVPIGYSADYYFLTGGTGAAY